MRLAVSTELKSHESLSSHHRGKRTSAGSLSSYASVCQATQAAGAKLT